MGTDNSHVDTDAKINEVCEFIEDSILMSMNDVNLAKRLPKIEGRSRKKESFENLRITRLRICVAFLYPRHARRISKTTEPFRGELTGWSV